jgi:pimeloyl-ACP methyl ester carboxylesterase
MRKRQAGAERRRLRTVIAMDVYGEGSPLVLVHGVATSRSIWRHVVPGLVQRHLVATPDMPGFGASPPIGRGFVLEDVADALADALAILPAPFDLLGNSLGGAVAIVLAERRPDLVRRLILAAPAGLAPHRAPIPAIAGRVSATVVAARRRVAPRLVGNTAARRVLLYGLLTDPAAISPEEARATIAASRGAKRVGPAIAVVAAADLRARLAGLTMPVGFLWGDRDHLFPVSTLEELRALVPGSRAEVIAGAGHVPQLDAPDEFVAAVERLLEQDRD